MMNSNKKCIMHKVILLLFVITSSMADDEYMTEYKEKRYLEQYLNYLDVITDFKLSNMLRLSQIFVEDLLESIPHEDRGNSAELLQQYITRSEILLKEGGSIREKENLLLELQQLIITIKAGLEKQENEDVILRKGLLGMFELLARLSIEERKHSEKIGKALIALRKRFSTEGIQRHQELFDVLNNLAHESDVGAKEQLIKQLRELRQRMY